MNTAEFVQNIKKYCDIKGIKPTVACKESGAGKDLINQIERRGSMPSVEKVQLLADYLDVSTSLLLGELKFRSDRMASLMKKHNKTLQQLSVETKLPPSTLSNYKNGKSAPNDIYTPVIALARALHTTPEYLMDISNEEEENDPSNAVEFYEEIIFYSLRNDPKINEEIERLRSEFNEHLARQDRDKLLLYEAVSKFNQLNTEQKRTVINYMAFLISQSETLDTTKCFLPSSDPSALTD